MAESFTCALCSETFLKAWSDEEAEAEYSKLFPKEKAAAEPRAVLCDDCWKAFVQWKNSPLSPEEEVK